MNACFAAVHEFRSWPKEPCRHRTSKSAVPGEADELE
jgi:hypothetical protein